MKNVVVTLIITMVLGVSYADTPVNREDVVMGLLERLVCDIEDNFDETNEEQDVDWVSWTQEGFFGEMSTNQTEQMLYRKAFDAVLENFATNGCQSLSACDSPIPQQEVARVALCQVRDMSYGISSGGGCDIPFGAVKAFPDFEATNPEEDFVGVGCLYFHESDGEVFSR